MTRITPENSNLKEKVRHWLQQEMPELPVKRLQFYEEALVELAEVAILLPGTRLEVSKMEREQLKIATQKRDELTIISHKRGEAERELNRFNRKRDRIKDLGKRAYYREVLEADVKAWKLLETMVETEKEDATDPLWRASKTQILRKPLSAIINLWNEDSISSNEQKKMLISFLKEFDYVSEFGDPINGPKAWSEFPIISEDGLPIATDEVLRNQIEYMYQDIISRSAKRGK
jgi:hypothetical protein|tara:strand:- start:439 stop:1134 length:696 start_codon:yes stop_codon:yes gene_type:complete